MHYVNELLQLTSFTFLQQASPSWDMTLNAYSQILSTSKFFWTFVPTSAFSKLLSKTLLNVQRFLKGAYFPAWEMVS